MRKEEGGKETMEILGGRNCVGNSRDQGGEIAILDKNAANKNPSAFSWAKMLKSAKVKGK